MWPVLAYKTMLFLGFLLCVVFAYKLFRDDDAKSVVDRFTFTKWFVIEKPRSGTVFVAMAMVCFVTLVSTRSEWRVYDDGSSVVNLAMDVEPPAFISGLIGGGTSGEEFAETPEEVTSPVSGEVIHLQRVGVASAPIDTSTRKLVGRQHRVESDVAVTEPEAHDDDDEGEDDDDSAVDSD